MGISVYPRGGSSTPDTTKADTSGSDAASNDGGNATMSTGTGGTGRKMQATVIGYGTCLTQGMACGVTGSPGKQPTAALSAYPIPKYGSGLCGTCWRASNLRGLDYEGNGPPTVGGALKSPAGNGMVVLINNSCAPGADQTKPGAVGQCNQNHGGKGARTSWGVILCWIFVRRRMHR
ncbi:MAG: hypothetical protein OHK93_005247 [Ramalina farinacea]|uniref:Uncharacterized protein n=1 Tax=Ramalina farinacea TaxID=258253 RepID=A0AA43U2C5_9LECA|nr:hypothetical protein [Ramalina farinacea]